MANTGVLITGFGAPEGTGPDTVGPFMCNLMGREPSEELLTRICRRYLAVGGSPLNEIAVEIMGQLNQSLIELGHQMPIAVGMRYAPPFIPDALAQLKEAGCDRVVVVSLSPFESKVAHGSYREAMDAAVSELGHMEIVEAPLIGDLPEYAEFYASSAAVAITELEPNEGALLLFSAHSLPMSDLVDHDPYVTGLERVASDIVEQLGLGEGVHGPKEPMLEGIDAFGSVQEPRAWFLGYQSKGARGGEWLGPDLDELIDAVAKTEANAVVVVPIGFMTDHLETLYDLDIDAAGRALAADLDFMRAVAPNANGKILEAVARKVVELA